MSDSAYTEADMARAQDSEVALVTRGKVLVPTEGTYLVVDGETHTNLTDMAFIIDRARAAQRREGSDE